MQRQPESWQDEPVDQFRLPWASAPGEPVEHVLHVTELEGWARARATRCGHIEPNDRCDMCHGTARVAAAFGGSDRVRVLPGA